MRRRAQPSIPDHEADDDLPVMVPLFSGGLVPMDPQRTRRLRRHLVQSLRATRTEEASPLRPGPAGFLGEIARAACALCRGFCCKGGGEHGYLDEGVMQRVRRARPELKARAVIRLYVERVPAIAYAGSCVFHGESGCTLDRSLRSDVCNSYFCAGLVDVARVGTVPGAVAIIAKGEGKGQRTSRLRQREKPESISGCSC